MDAPSSLKSKEVGWDSPLPLYSLTVQSPKNTYTKLRYTRLRSLLKTQRKLQKEKITQEKATYNS